MAINRYRDMLDVVPKGDFYSSNGQIIPYRGPNNPYSFFFRVGKAATEYRVTVNGRDNGTVVSDANGDVRFGAPPYNVIALDLGENEIILYEEFSTNKVVGYITTRNSATLMASVAQAMEGSYVSDGTLDQPGIDSDVRIVREGSILETADLDFAENVFGKMVRTPHIDNYGLSVYRGLVRGLRSAYRHYGGTYEGINRVVRAYTHVSPLVLDFSFARSWKLGKDFIEERNLYVYQDSSNSLQNGVSIVDTNLGCSDSHVIEYDSATSKFRLFNASTYVYGDWVSVTPGQYISVTLHDGMYSRPLIGQGPFDVQASSSIEVDFGNGPVLIPLTAGNGRTALDVSSDINAALSASTSYGPSYGSCAYAGTSSGEPSALGTYLCIKNISGDAVYYGSQTMNMLFGVSANTQFVMRAAGGDKYLRLQVEDSSALGVSRSETFKVSGSGVPLGWTLRKHSDGTISSASQPKYRPFDTDAYLISGGMEIVVPISDSILKYKNFIAKASVFGASIDSSVEVSSMQVSFDGGATYSSLVPVSSGIAVSHQFAGKRYDCTFFIPASATGVLVKVITTGATSEKFRLDRINLAIQNVFGLHLGSGTIPRSDSRIKNGQNIFIWSPEELTNQEKSHLGINEYNGTNTGHVASIVPANTWAEIYDVTEYVPNTNVPADPENLSKNVVGAYNYTHFQLGESENLALNDSSLIPARFSYMEPLVVSSSTENVLWSGLTASATADLSYSYDMDASKSILYEDGVPMTSDEWSFVDSRTIRKTYAPIDGSVYTLEAQRLTRFTTDILDLGAEFSDYIWFADAHVWLRPDIMPRDSRMQSQLIFDTNGNAKLPVPSNGNKFVATITEDGDTESRTVPVSSWSYTSIDTVNVSLGEINRQYLYSIDYVSRISVSDTKANFKLEIRSSDTEDVDTQVWREVSINEVVDNTKRYHQMRVTIYNIEDTTDARVYSVLLKGLNMYGAGVTVPVLRPS